MKNHLKTWAKGTIVTLAAVLTYGTAFADFVGNTYTNGADMPTAWDHWGGLTPFYSSISAANLRSATQSGQYAPGNLAIPGAAYYQLGETLTAPQAHYNLKAISVLMSGTASGLVQMHLFDITGSLKSNNGPITNGSGANYSITGDLLGGGSGITFTNTGSLGATNQWIFTLGTGTNDDTGIVLGDGHYYVLEFWEPSTATTLINWWRTGGGDPGDGSQEGQGFLGGGEYGQRQTITTAGGAGGAPRDYCLALFGTATSSPITVSTNPPPGLVANFVDTFLAAGISGNVYSAGQITNVWTNWYGSAVTYPSGITWDTADAHGNANSGAMEITAAFDGSGNTQFAVMDGFAGINPAFNGAGLISFECDVRFDPGSPTTLNGSVANFGHLQFGTVSNAFTSQDYFGNVEIAAGNTNWTHISIPINSATDTNLATIYNVIFHIDGNWYSGSPLNGTTKLFIDNVRFVGLQTVATTPPTMQQFSKAVPGLRFVAPNNGSPNSRQNIASQVSALSWIGSEPFAYSIQVTNFASASATNFEFHMWLVPIASLPYDPYSNTFEDNDSTNVVSFKLLASGSNYVGQVLYKLNTYHDVPTNIVAAITNTTAIGTWTVNFTSDTGGTLTAPGGASASFTIPSAVAAAFDPNLGGTLAYYGILPNLGANLGQAVDIAKIVAGPFVSDMFSADDSLDTNSTWTITAQLPASIWLATTKAKYWVNWNYPDTGYGLVESTNLNSGTAWVNPSIYNSHTPVETRLLGNTRWALIPTNGVPAVASKLFFTMKHPAPAN